MNTNGRRRLRFFSRAADETLAFREAYGSSSSLLNSPAIRTGHQSAVPSDGGNGSFTTPADRAEFAHNTWAVGWIDGKEGQPSDGAEDVFLQHARLLAHSRQTELREHLAKSNAEAAGLDEEISSARREQSRLGDLSAKLSAAWAESPGRFSIGLGVFYLVLSFILFGADIPLSLRLVAEGFKIRPDARIPNEVLSGTISTSDLLRHPLLVLGYLWEPLLLALGIALAGIMVKVFLDDGLRLYDNRRPRLKLFLTMLLVLVLFIAALVAVGFLRAERSSVELRANRTRTSLVNFGGANTTQATSTSSPSGQRQDEFSVVAFLAFLALTLTLPLVGGVLFAAGWDRVQNGLQYRKLRTLEGKTERRIVRAVSGRHALQERANLLNEQLGHLDDDQLPQAALWSALHRHGYMRGAVSPEAVAAQGGIYAICERLLARSLVSAERAGIWKRAGKRGEERR